MANYGLLSGLGDALQTFGKIGLKEWSDSEDELRDAKKMQLKNKLDMDLMKAKYQFMKENPRYKQFFTDLSGNRIGVDEMGNERMVHQATPEESELAKAEKESKINYNKALAAAAQGRSEVVDSTIEKNKALTEAARARAGRDSRYQPATKKDPSVLAPIQWDNGIESYIKRKLGNDYQESAEPDAIDAARKEAADYLRKSGYTRGFQGGAGGASSGLGAFANAPGLSGGGGGGLLSTSGEEVPDSEPDDDEDDLE